MSNKSIYIVLFAIFALGALFVNSMIHETWAFDLYNRFTAFATQVNNQLMSR